MAIYAGAVVGVDGSCLVDPGGSDADDPRVAGGTVDEWVTGVIRATIACSGYHDNAVVQGVIDGVPLDFACRDPAQAQIDDVGAVVRRPYDASCGVCDIARGTADTHGHDVGVRGN